MHALVDLTIENRDKFTVSKFPHNLCPNELCVNNPPLALLTGASRNLSSTPSGYTILSLIQPVGCLLGAFYTLLKRHIIFSPFKLYLVPFR
jgi:hypothetical protein